MFDLNGQNLDAATVVRLARDGGSKVSIAGSAEARIGRNRRQVEESVRRGQRVYGVNTGFGFLSDVAIADDKIEQLQLNLIRSHACGVGEWLPAEVSRAMLLIKAGGFMNGCSGVRLEVVRQLLDFFNLGILPLIPIQGSVGASGDLAPLAHLALALIGEGEVFFKSQRMSAARAMDEAGLTPLQLKAKEGLSLINGTQFMTAVGCFAIEEAVLLSRTADIAAAMSLDGIRGTLTAFDARIHAARNQPGQEKTARNVLSMFAGGDGINDSHKDCGRVQDPYSFRCVPQVHGASKDALAYVQAAIDRELNAATDNPLVFEDGAILSGGNFHGQPVAMPLDFLAIAVSELGSISERRIEKLTNPHMSGLPAFMAQDSGLNSGFMIPHVVAAALASENKVLAHPAVVDSIPTSADKEDHVSMGPIAAVKARKVNRNVANILAIELLAASQALDLLRPLKSSAAIERIYEGVRSRSPAMPVDRSLSQDIAEVADWILAGGVAAMAPFD